MYENKQKKYTKNDALNAQLMISLNGPQLGTRETKELIKHTARIYGEWKQYKKAPSIKQKEQETQNYLKHTQVMPCVESEFMGTVEECLDAITPEKYIISNFNETSETEDSDTVDKVMSL